MDTRCMLDRIISRISVCLLGGILALSMVSLTGCGDSTTIIQESPTQSIPSTATPFALSAQLGTGLSGSGQTATITGPTTTTFTPSDTLAFVIHLRMSVNASQVACIIYDPHANMAYLWHINTRMSDTTLASSTPSLGTILDSANDLGTPTPHTAPAGTYQLVVTAQGLTYDFADFSFTYSGDS